MTDYYILKDNRPSYGTLELAESEALKRAKESGEQYAVVKLVSVAIPEQRIMYK